MDRQGMFYSVATLEPRLTVLDLFFFRWFITVVCNHKYHI